MLLYLSLPLGGDVCCEVNSITPSQTNKTIFKVCFFVCFSTGNFEVGVHIADVSYFVKENTALDETASQRATSVYMVQRVSFFFLLSKSRIFLLTKLFICCSVAIQVIPMLPPVLCVELCSLNPLVDRLTFSVIWKLTPEGEACAHKLIAPPNKYNNKYY